MRYLILILILLIRLGNSFSQVKTPLFTTVSHKHTNIDFKNEINENEAMNVLAYEYFYNGGGMAIGDINNDGLPDLFFTANLRSNKLYINNGNLQFRDITRRSGTGGRKDWKTGVTMADVNGDGWLDIYVCYSGKGEDRSRKNELFINNRDLSFSEKAEEYGLDDAGCSTQAVFFDYDLDGDLDCYVLNHNNKVFKNVELKYLKVDRDPLAGDRLYRNEGGKFKDITQAAGISGNPISFGLGIAASDINGDGWPDLYVSNDYTEQDYCFINNANGTFSQQEMDMFSHLSQFSMGSDIADINNDGLVDIITLDMLPEDNRRQKLLQAQENYELYREMSANGFHYQFMRNMLHLNNGDGTFSEIGQLSGISNTDWSWAPLFADLDNDGFKDLFITNGYMRDYTNKDFMKFWGDYLVKQAANRDSIRFMDIISRMPSTMVTKYIFRNKGDLTFENVTTQWGINRPALSNGAAYGDLDNDGDLDMIINNINENATVLRNESDKISSNHYLKIKLAGSGKNHFGLGAKVYCYTGTRMQFIEQMPTRGYQSSVSEILHFGLGDSKKVDSLKVRWPDGTIQKFSAINADTTITLYHEKAESLIITGTINKKMFTLQKPFIDYSHRQPDYNDFKRQSLMPSMLSQCGPRFAIADFNGDGREDIFFGSSEGQSSELFIQRMTGEFAKSVAPAFIADSFSTSGDILVFDADGDKDLDIYAVSGGYNYYSENDLRLQDRLFRNDGKGKFELDQAAIPEMTTAKSTAASADMDGDGDEDIFVGGRSIPGKYPVAPQSWLLSNDGKGRFSDVTEQWFPGLSHIGMVTDAKWSDINKDGKPDLILLGEWMTPFILINEGNKFRIQPGLMPDLPGLWNTFELADFDNDGDEDMVAGNWGLNSQLHCSKDEPLEMIYKDFDGNGSIDPFLCCYIQGKSYPYISRDELLDQIYSLRRKFTSYALYSDATMNDIFSLADINSAVRLKATHLATTYFENRQGTFLPKELPVQAQFSPVYKICTEDIDKDGDKDLLLLGNNSYLRLKIGKMDANFGTILLNDGNGNFHAAPKDETGLLIVGDVKDAGFLKVNDNNYLLIGINNSGLLCLKFNR